MNNTNIASITTSNRVRLEVVGHEQLLLDFANIDWETAFRGHGGLALNDLASRTEVKPFEVAHLEYGPVSAVSRWSTTTKDSFIAEWAKAYTDLTFVYSIINETEALIETKVSRVDYFVSTGMNYSDRLCATPSDYPFWAFDLYTQAMSYADLPSQFSRSYWEI